MDGGFTLFKYADTEVELSTLPQASVESDEYKAFVSDRILSPNEPFGEATDGKKPKKLDINKVDEDTARGIHEARGQEWGKYQQYNAAVPIMGPMLEGLLRQGHVPIPSQSVDVDKNEFKKGLSDYEPKYRSRLVSCGNCEGVSRNELTCDAPTVDAETHCLIASYAASRKLKLRCGARKDSKLNKIAPGLYYVLGSDNLPAVLLGTHVDDLLWCATPEGEVIMERIMAKFDMGKVEDTDFRYCGRRFRQDEHFNVTTDTEDNTRSIRHIVIDPNRKSTEPATDQDARAKGLPGSRSASVGALGRGHAMPPAQGSSHSCSWMQHSHSLAHGRSESSLGLGVTTGGGTPLGPGPPSLIRREHSAGSARELRQTRRSSQPAGPGGPGGPARQRFTGLHPYEVRHGCSQDAGESRDLGSRGHPKHPPIESAPDHGLCSTGPGAARPALPPLLQGRDADARDPETTRGKRALGALSPLQN
eukprot:s1497_g3.t5